jgi:hypothetical protein
MQINLTTQRLAAILTVVSAERSQCFITPQNVELVQRLLRVRTQTVLASSLGARRFPDIKNKMSL